MSDRESRDHISAEEEAHLLELTEIAVHAENLEGLAQGVLPLLMRVVGATGAILFLEEPKPPFHCLFQEGIQSNSLPLIKRICTEEFQQNPIQDDSPPIIVPLSPQEAAHLVLFSLGRKTKKLGFLGLVMAAPEKPPRQILMRKITGLLAYFIDQVLGRLAYDEKIAHLNTYLAVSSKIAQTLDLRKVIEAVLYSSIEAVSAEAAYVLLLDSEKKNFRFFGVEGPAKPVLLNVTFPVNQGLAGYVFQTQKSAIFNDVQQDPRFYGKFDSVSGFQTRNLVAIPLVAGDEKIGILEVLNKAGDEPFYEDDRLLLQSIAEEIAFAIHNANICEEKQTLAAEIQRMHQFQTKLIQTSNDGIIANDQHGNIIIFNEGAERVLGYRKDEVIGKITVDQLYPPGVAQEVRAKIYSPEYGGTERLIHFETIVLSKTGEQIPIELSASLIYGNDHEVTTVGFFRDLRERKQLQDKLLQSERLAALGQMAAHISHEIKNPLATIGGFAQQLGRQEGFSEKGRQKLELISQEVQRLEKFLADLSTFTRTTPTQKVPGDILALIREVIGFMEAGFKEQGVTFELSTPEVIAAFAFDPGQIRQVLINLFKNSLEAMPHGGVLRVSAAVREDHLVLTIADTGLGIAPEHLRSLFTPFFSTKEGGTGLGLTICRGLIDQHRGEIDIRSEVNRGTTCTIRLPLVSS
jgi:PAS domain S-box-containing protein